MWVGRPDFWERQVENRDKTGKCPISQSSEREFLLFVIEW